MEGLVSHQVADNDDAVSLRINRGSVQRQPLLAASFEAQLCRERRRAERSGRLIALLQVACPKGSSGSADRMLCDQVIEALSSSMRLIDIVGWSVDYEIAGVILTEFGSFDPVKAAPRIQARVTTAIGRALQSIKTGPLRLTIQFFPEDSNVSGDPMGIDLTFYPEFNDRHRRNSLRENVKRMVDIAGSGGALVMLSPVLAAIAIAIRVTSSGPALYRQERIGQFGVGFTMYKFRTMHFKSESGIHEEFVKQFICGNADPTVNEGRYKLSKDPRVTRLGRFLRKTSLDELPQFFNTLRGDMSLVGPRPPLRYEFTVYEPWHMRRLLEAKPGLTGLWQVTGRSKTRFDEMVRLDLRYAERRSLLFDFVLLAKTVSVLISDQGAC